MWCYRSSRFRSIVRSVSLSTIFALSSGQGKCGVAVIRISGQNAKEAIFKMTACQTLPSPRKAVLTAIKDPVTGEQIDRGITIWFPGPKSFTGEDSCEFQVHGGLAVVTSMLQSLSKLPEFKMAAPGEFTKRAFLAGKMDLTEVEGLADLIHAETEQQRRQALKQMEGGLAQLYAAWRAILLKNTAHIEAYIDFSESEDIEEGVLEGARKNLHDLSRKMKAHLEDGRKGLRLHNGVRTAIIGEPNVGKSSLLNFLVRRPAAIVTSIAGTTRDIVEVPIDIGGYPVVLADTAGLREDTTDVIEIEGIKRAREWCQNADLVVIVVDAKRIPNVRWDDYLHTILSKLNFDSRQPRLVMINKIDLLSREEILRIQKIITENVVCVSCQTEEGLQKLLSIITDNLKQLCGNPSTDSPTLTQERHRFHLQNSLNSLEDSLKLFDEKDISLSAHKLKQSMRNLGNITGEVSTEDILNVIFRDFCVGK